MKPGRELDALVAEKVLGWENNKNGHRYAGWREEQIWAMNDGPIIDCPCYSTSIADAWEVVEKIHTSQFNWSSCEGFWDGKQTGTELSLNMTYDHKEGYEVRLMDMHNNTLHMATAPTASHAICLAALKAVEQK